MHPEGTQPHDWGLVAKARPDREMAEAADYVERHRDERDSEGRAPVRRRGLRCAGTQGH